MRQNTRLQVEIRLWCYLQEGAGWRLWVHDNGHGIEPARESKSTRTFGNLLVATVVSRMNAEIRYMSERGTKVDVICGVT